MWATQRSNNILESFCVEEFKCKIIKKIWIIIENTDLIINQEISGTVSKQMQYIKSETSVDMKQTQPYDEKGLVILT